MKSNIVKVKTRHWTFKLLKGVSWNGNDSSAMLTLTMFECFAVGYPITQKTKECFAVLLKMMRIAKTKECFAVLLKMMRIANSERETGDYRTTSSCIHHSSILSPQATAQLNEVLNLQAHNKSKICTFIQTVTL